MWRLIWRQPITVLFVAFTIRAAQPSSLKVWGVVVTVWGVVVTVGSVPQPGKRFSRSHSLWSLLPHPVLSRWP